MGFKKLGLFQRFDSNAFFRDKHLVQMAEAKTWKDYDTDEVKGVKVEVVILEDKTPYPTKNGETVTNRFEKFTVKVRKNAVSTGVNDAVELVNPVCTVYGDFRNQLSVTCDDIVKAGTAQAVAPSQKRG